MPSLRIKDVYQYVEKNIFTFHKKRIESLHTLSLKKVLSRKNPYLYKAKNIKTSEELIRGIVDAHISSNEETLFGDWLEELAIFINHRVYQGRKSGIPGIDLEFDKDGTRYLVSIKSGPNWGNSSQLRKMVTDFNAAIRTLRTSNSDLHIIAVNGCCYGRDPHPLKKDNYYKYCGQTFWEFLSGNPRLYTEIVEPLGHLAKERNEEFLTAYGNQINLFTLEFSRDFCTGDGSIDWERVVKYSSGKE